MALLDNCKGVHFLKNILPDQINTKCESLYPWQMWAVRAMEYLSGQSKARLILWGLLALGLLGMMDRIAGNQLFASMLCFIPILLVTWFGGIWMGVLTSVAGNFVILSTDVVSGWSTSYWDTGVRLGSFLMLNLVLSALKSSLQHEREFGRIDFLTGVSNRRSFTELAEMEIHRARRYDHPFTVIYIDLDDFKMVNDRFGHAMGDKLLRLLAQALHKKIRATDLVARLGGDEFGILLPETGPEVAELIVRRLQDVGVALMQKKGWPMPFSMGVVTFLEPPASIDEMLIASDTVMYAAKKNGKHGVCREIFPKSELPAKPIVEQPRLLKRGDLAVQEFKSTGAERPGV
jgi:diguanylate cyclase (GGDEF)-like protein